MRYRSSQNEIQVIPKRDLCHPKMGCLLGSLDTTDSEQEEKPKKITKKKPSKKFSDSEQDEKPKKIIRKKKY